MIKLFGRTIQLISNEDDKDMLSSQHNQLSSSTTTHETKVLTQSNHGQSIGIKEVVEQTNEEPRTPNVDEETTIQELGGSSGISEDLETSTVDKETSSPDRNDKEDPNDMTSDSEEKTLIMPDKLIPCPRCSSMDTKFCYYNNYNVSQPRHFCKKCQRYWTAGGTMRNVPVGSGRRKNKCSPASQFRQIIISEALQAANGIHQMNGKLLGFGSDSSQSGSMASALIHAQKAEISVRSGCFEGNDPRIPFSYGAKEMGDDNSSGSSSTVISPNEKELNIQESPLQVPCFPVPPWASPWNIPQWSSTMQQPAFGPPGFPISFYPPPPYWGCPAPNPWNTPWLYPQCPSSDLSVRSPDPDSQTLGKHSRDGSMISTSNPEKLELEEKDLKPRVLTPKALRIHDQSEAAQSSIWSTLGIKNEHIESVNEASVHKAFCAKGVQKNHMMTKASMFLQANPAALQRSFNYQETA